MVYQLNCNNCQVTYVGESKRELKNRISDHKRYTNNKENKVVSNHCNNKKHSINWEKTKILDIEDNYFKRQISEMLHIHTQKEPINKKEDTKCLHDNYIHLLNTIVNTHKYTHT